MKATNLSRTWQRWIDHFIHQQAKAQGLSESEWLALPFEVKAHRTGMNPITFHNAICTNYGWNKDEILETLSQFGWRDELAEDTESHSTFFSLISAERYHHICL